IPAPAFAGVNSIGNPRPSWVPATGVPATRASRGAPRGDERKRLSRCSRDFMRSRGAGPPPKNFYGKGGTSREVGHWCWWNELYDPLSSFVPVLEPRPRRGFSFG